MTLPLSASPRWPLPLLTAAMVAACQPITSGAPEPAGDAHLVAAGTRHACAVLTSGTLRCWGAAGLVGDRTRAPRPEPVAVSGLGSGVGSVGVGAAHACALTTGGGVQCWGSGELGQIGNGATEDALAPVEVFSDSVTSLATGANHTCAVRPLGDVWCWGANGSWQLGPGAGAQSDVPVRVTGLPDGIRSVSAGAAHSCVVTVEGQALCWGSNEFGQLGNGAVGGLVATPALVSLPAPVTALTAGRGHTCATVVGGSVYCWGHNADGALGDDTGIDSPTPVQPRLGSGTLEVVAGGDSSCAVTSSSAAVCWGDNSFGQVGDGTRGLHRPAPVPVVGLDADARTVSVGDGFTCAVTRARRVLCWGHNADGQLGDGTNLDRDQPAPVVGL